MEGTAPSMTARPDPIQSTMASNWATSRIDTSRVSREYRWGYLSPSATPRLWPGGYLTTPLRGFTFRGKVAVVVAASCLFVSHSAFAYRTAGDTADFAGTGAVAWQSSQVSILISDSEAGPLVPSGVDAVLAGALASWSAVECAPPKFILRAHTYAPARPGDGLNTVQWVRSRWASFGFPTDAAAMTDVQYEQQQTGRWAIVEADLYLNAEDFSWALGPSDNPDTEDLESVLLHESGHIIGLLHPCEQSPGTDAPVCGLVPPLDESVMYPAYRGGATKPGSDDVAGTCYLYPRQSCASGTCSVDVPCTGERCEPSCGGQHCANHQTCVNDACINASESSHPPQREGQLWDPCAADNECALGSVCTPDGYCTEPCLGLTTCGVGSSCGQEGLCSPVGGVFGDACSAATDCSSAVCLKRAEGQPTCTRACVVDEQTCPRGYTCQNLDREGPVCAPILDQNPGCTCRVVGNAGASRPKSAFWLLLACASARLGRRRRTSLRAVMGSNVKVSYV